MEPDFGTGRAERERSQWRPLDQALAVLWQAGAGREELIQLPWALPVPLPVHGHYSRAVIKAAYCFAEACGYGVLTTDAPWIHREGVLWNDLALGPALFHWESQRTIHHASRSSRP